MGQPDNWRLNRQGRAANREKLRWRLRRPEFQSGLNALMDRLSQSHKAFNIQSTVEAMTAVRKFEAQWDVSSLIRHPELFQHQDGPRLSDDNIASFEKILLADLSSGRLDSHLIARLTKKACKALGVPTPRTRLINKISNWTFTTVSKKERS